MSRIIKTLVTHQAAEEDMINQKQKLQHEVKELHSHIQVENIKYH